MADGGSDVAGPGALSARRAQPDCRAPVQPRLPDYVVAPDVDALPGRGQHQSPGDQPVDGGGAHPPAHGDSSRNESLRSPPRRERCVLAAAGGQLSGQMHHARAGGPAGLFLPDPGPGSPRSAVPGRDRPGCLDDALRLGTELETPFRHAAAAVHISCLGALFPRDEAAVSAGDRWHALAVVPVHGNHLYGAWRSVRGRERTRDRARLRHVPVGRRRSVRGGCLAAPGTWVRVNSRVDAVGARTGATCRLLEGKTRTNQIELSAALGRKELARETAEGRLRNSARSAGASPFNE